VFSSRVKLVVIATVGIALAGFAIWAVSGGGGASGSSQYRGSLLPPNIPIADFSLSDETGKPTSLSSLKGSPSMVTFLYTDCKDVCPITAQQIRGAMDQVGQDVPVVAITSDPVNDTPAKVKRWLALQRLQGRMHWGLGTGPEVSKVWQQWGVAGQTAKADHSAYVFVLDRDGRRCVSWPTSQLTPEGLSHDLKLLLANDGVCRP